MDNFNPQFQKIGDILVHQKIITSEQLNNALTEQKSTKDKLGSILISQGTITEDELVNAYSMQCGHRSISKDEMLNLRKKLRSDILLVVDDAYFEFITKNDFSSGLNLFKDNENVLITRTFSKIYGLAGLRLGFGYSSK